MSGDSYTFNIKITDKLYFIVSKNETFFQVTPWRTDHIAEDSEIGSDGLNKQHKVSYTYKHIDY